MAKSFLLLSALLISLSGCAVAPAQRVEYVGTRVMLAPPPPRVEVISMAPAPHWYWAGGHWAWQNNSYVWVGGHWVEPREREVFVQAYWSRERGNWVFHPAQWRPMRASAEVVLTSTPKAPPPPRIEVIPTPPGIDYFWINGHWGWQRGEHAWVSGHWEAHRPGAHWAHAHWVRVGPAWQLRGDHWQ